MSIEQRAAELVATGLDDSRIVTRIRKEATPAELEEYLLAAVDAARRSITRAAERGVITGVLASYKPTPGSSLTLSQTVADNYEKLRQMWWSDASGMKFLVGQATVDQVRERIQMLISQRDGIDRTLADLQTVERVLVDSGARCLDDLAVTVVA